MAIKRYNLYDSTSASNTDTLCLTFLRDALIPNWLGENGTVVQEANGCYGLYDGDGVLIANLANYAGNVSGSGLENYIAVDSSHTIGFQYNYTRFKTGYKTSKGAMIILDGSDSSTRTGAGILIFGKTNNGEPAMVLKNPSVISTISYSYVQNAATAYLALVGARGDDIASLNHSLTFYPYAHDIYPGSFDENQTVFCPTPTHSNPGETSIIEGVFMLPWAQYRTEATIQSGNKHYVTNGYWAIEDE
jgi:hypothetical protein